jgi:hypothetical protein
MPTVEIDNKEYFIRHPHNPAILSKPDYRNMHDICILLAWGTVRLGSGFSMGFARLCYRLHIFVF